MVKRVANRFSSAIAIRLGAGITLRHESTGFIASFHRRRIADRLGTTWIYNLPVTLRRFSSYGVINAVIYVLPSPAEGRLAARYISQGHLHRLSQADLIGFRDLYSNRRWGMTEPSSDSLRRPIDKSDRRGARQVSTLKILDHLRHRYPVLSLGT
jgi:hypothetical protein